MTRLSFSASVLSALLLSSFAWAQTHPSSPPRAPAASTEAPRAIIYRDIRFQGPETVLTGTAQNLQMRWPTRSIRIISGTWELCTRRNFRGPCRRYDASESSIPSAAEYTQSARPVG